ncbi:MAG: hypothetical protein JO307_25940 [Bryobacterales bacterium]|nr:hypothetical protein [Bryobacterales bacterium]
MPPVVAVGVLIAGLATAWMIHWIAAHRQPEAAVLRTGLVFGAILMTALAAYIARRRSRAQAVIAALIFLTTCSILLLGIYFFRVSGYVLFPADFLVWPEGDFVNDIIKLSTGYPLYSAQVNNDSFVYVPGPQLLTFALAFVTGHGFSIPWLRAMQLVYTCASAFVALLCWRRILKLSTDSQMSPSWIWHGLCYAALLLVATNAITNPFIHNLHGDALAQLVTVTAYYLLLRYVRRPSGAALAMMCLAAPAGFLVKQSLLIWAGLFAAYLRLWGKSRKQLLIFLPATATLCAVTAGICYELWGQSFFYWTWYVLGKHAVSPLRSFEHLLDAWTYFAGGLLGGIVVLRGGYCRELLGAWLIWLALIATETYTSGIAWMLNHIGPASLLAGVWLFSGLTRLCAPAADTRPNAEGWFQAAAVTACIALLFYGMGFVRIPLQPIPDDAYRYVRDIEAQFAGEDASKILLDAGSWVYIKQRVVMGDRAPSIGERGYTQTGDFSGMLSRIANKRYNKILVRGLHTPDFVYDYYLWPKSSGIRQALAENYRETGRIPAAQGAMAPNWAEDPYYFGEITILEPRGTTAGL